MIARMFAIVPAMVLALGAATTQAEPAGHPHVQFRQARVIDHATPPRPFGQAGAEVTNAAYVSDGSDPSYLWVQKELLNEPGYSIGTGAAEVYHARAIVGDGSGSSYLRDPQDVLREPGYSVGTGAASVSGAW
jgi:hypothetical protein